jgi:hypothetical protein
MTHGDPLAITPKRVWTQDQWDIYRRMPWLGRRLADTMILMPSLSKRFGSWIMTRQERPLGQARRRVVSRMIKAIGMARSAR